MRAMLPSMVRGWRAAMLLVVAACVTPDRAKAGCGDYVTILNGDPAAAHHTADSAKPDHSPPPCHGPNCSNAPVDDPAPLAPVAPTGPEVKDVAAPLVTGGEKGDARTRFDRDPFAARPIYRASSIFHPPRLG